MLGNYTYCMRNGHDWSKTWKLNALGGVMMECSICGARQVKWL